MRNKNSFKNQDVQALRKTRNFVFSLLVSQVRRFPKLRRPLGLVAEREEWVSYVENIFGESTFFWTRENLWRELRKELRSQKNWTVYEFGVAWGYATNHWLSRCDGLISTWHGFDRFIGLPRSWRDLDENSFYAGGVAPDIKDSRVTWHIGDVEDKLPLLEIQSGPKMILFDLDIYEPTNFAWVLLKSSLNSGDLIYFDEGYDRDERRVIDENVRKDFEVSVIGMTHTAIAFKLGNRLGE